MNRNCLSMGICIFLMSSCLFLCSCARTITGTLHPTTAIPTRTTTKPVDMKNTKVLVLSPTSIEQVSGSLTLEKHDASSKAKETAAGISQTTDYNMALSVAEGAFLNNGWNPISQAKLAAALSSSNLRDKLYAKRNPTLLETALILGTAIGADSVFLIRSIQVGYANEPSVEISKSGCNSLRIVSSRVSVDAVLASARSGEILWTGVSEVRGTDFLPEPVLIPFGPERSKYSKSYGHLRLVGHDDGEECGFNIIPSLLCYEYGDGSCATSVTISDTSVLSMLMDRSVNNLVSSIRRK